MERKQIRVTDGPKAIGPYSSAIQAGETLYISGQLPVDVSSQIVGDSIGDQTKQAIDNLELTLQAAGLTLNDVVKTTVFLSDFNNFDKMNQIYAIYFTHPYPARSCFEVSRLPKDALVEIEAIAVAKVMPSFEPEPTNEDCEGRYCED
ncbi:RidA family protein [Erysipelothrix sp. HDW6C]|uniref:RidA family protein n=1 Tax=Erysipelothrix sp. HDW6C TaxID=2714930 RepID=UPI0014078623|nr:RidA family protein [Erysipelothrix sp. HDW6C]QIK70343.1 RidA family protein [Erysipelothrix sp. HDW6C]